MTTERAQRPRLPGCDPLHLIFVLIVTTVAVLLLVMNMVLGIRGNHEILMRNVNAVFAEGRLDVRVNTAHEETQGLRDLKFTLGDTKQKITDTRKKLEEAQIMLDRSVWKANSLPKTCGYGVATVIAPRNLNGTEVEYWPNMLKELSIPGIDMVAVLNKLGKPLLHPRPTHIIVTNPPPEFDPGFLGRELKHESNDTPEAVKWRSMVVLDFVRIVRFVSEHCKYVIWIEDDASLPKGWLRAVQAINANQEPWVFRFLSKGMTAVLIQSNYAHFLLQYLLHHFDHEPLDRAIVNALEYLAQRFPGASTDASASDIIGHIEEVSSLEGAGKRPVF